MTPSQAELKVQGKTLMSHYVSLVANRKADILHFGNFLAVDGYFGVATFVNPVTQMGIEVISCLKSNSALHYVPVAQSAEKGRGRPRVKGDKINWSNVDSVALPMVAQEEGRCVRSGCVWVKYLRRVVMLLAVEYRRPDGSVQCYKLCFCTNTSKNWEWILERYSLRFKIEFFFRDAKQFTGLTHCQSTNQTKIENHVNLALGTVSVAKAVQRIPQKKDQPAPFSMAQLKTYYHNLALLEQFSIALNLNPTEIKNNPKVKELLFSSSYAEIAA